MEVLTDSQFTRIAHVAEELWGLHLDKKKFQLVLNRVRQFLRRSRFNSIEEYLDHLESGSPREEDLLLFFDALSTNTTSFFREIEAFNYLEREFYTPLQRGNLTLPGKRIRFWSAACSTGAEPYSLAIHAHETFRSLKQWDMKILATDLSQTALQKASAGTYPLKMVEDLDKKIVKRHFTCDTHKGYVTVAPHIREMVSVARLNLMEDWPMKGPFDVVFLRNVMIYFDRPTRERLVNRVYDLLRPGGALVIGSSETLSGCRTKYRTAQPAVYIK